MLCQFVVMVMVICPWPELALYLQAILQTYAAQIVYVTPRNS